MIVDFDKIEKSVIPNFKGGEKEFQAHMSVDENNKILLGKLVPGASVGEHTHEGNSEIMYFLQGTGKVLYDGTYEKVGPGVCHYCPMGHSHSVINDSDAELIFFAVIPEHRK